MKALILSLTLFIAIDSFAQFTIIPDPNFESALIGLGLDVAPLDGQVLTANINTLTLLDVSSKNISDLTGIQDFTALADLDIGSNALMELDISQNTNLVRLWCLYNPFTCINVQNGNNSNFTIFAAFQCPNLTCIQVDDTVYSNANWTGTVSGGSNFIFDPNPNFSEYCDGCNVSVDEIDQGDFSIYPNPASSYFTIEGLNEPYEISIYNSLGQLLYQKETVGVSADVDIRDFGNGMLFVRIEYEGEVYYRRVLKD